MMGTRLLGINEQLRKDNTAINLELEDLKLLLNSSRHKNESLRQQERSLRTMAKSAHDHVAALAKMLQQTRRDSQTEIEEMNSSECRFNTKVRYYESECTSMQKEREQIIEEAKQIQSLHEDQIEQVRAKHRDESTRAELTAEELEHARCEHKHHLGNLSTLMKSRLERVRRDSLNRARVEVETETERMKQDYEESRSQVQIEVVDMEDLIRHHRGEFETSTRRHARTLREVEEEHERILDETLQRHGRVRGEFETSTRRHAHTLREVEEEHERILDETLQRHDRVRGEFETSTRRHAHTLREVEEEHERRLDETLQRHGRVRNLSLNLYLNLSLTLSLTIHPLTQHHLTKLAQSQDT